MLDLENFVSQNQTWPLSGRHILAQFDEESIVVYSAFNPKIARFAVQKQRFGSDFSFERMSWIKPNFLWMQYRSGWNTKPNQERTLAVRVPLALWEEMLLQAVPSSFVEELYSTHEEWKRALAQSEVRVQWDPDHGPHGEKLERRALQIGLRGEILHRYSEENLGIEDVTDIVIAGHTLLASRRDEHLQTPRERVYWPRNPKVARRLGLSRYESTQKNSGDVEVDFWTVIAPDNDTVRFGETAKAVEGKS